MYSRNSIDEVSQIHRSRKWLASTQTDSLYASIITFGEIRLGIELLPERVARAHTEALAGHDLHVWFDAGLFDG